MHGQNSSETSSQLSPPELADSKDLDPGLSSALADDIISTTDDQAPQPRESELAAERELAAELEEILKIKPVHRVLDRPAGEDDAMGWFNKDAPESTTEGELQDSEDDATFEWQNHGEESTTSDSKTANEDQSLKWVAKARSDRRRRIARNALGWGASILVGSLVMGGAAWALTGWTPDLSSILAYGPALHS